MASFKPETFGERNNLVVRLAKGIQMVETNMNRRRFIHQLGSAVAAFTILPSATTYARKWSGTVQPRPWIQSGNLFVPNPDFYGTNSLVQYLWENESGSFVEVVVSRNDIGKLDITSRKWRRLDWKLTSST